MHCRKQPSLVELELACDSAPSAFSPGPTEGSDAKTEASPLLPGSKSINQSVSEDDP